MVSEIWAGVSGYYGLYMVSNFGRIKSLHGDKEKYLKGTPNKSGHLLVNLSLNGKPKCCLLHRLVAKEFIKNPMNYHDVDHIDQNPQNNNISNLRWASRSLNNSNSYKRKLKKTSKYNGVSWCSQTKSWKVSVYHNMKITTIGRFKNEIQAAVKYDQYCINNKLDRDLNFGGKYE